MNPLAQSQKDQIREVADIPRRLTYITCYGQRGASCVTETDTLVDLSGEEIGSIDLSPLSSCTQLLELDISRNSLKNIDLSALSSCSRLQRLYLSYNSLKSIDLSPLSSCTQLLELYLSYNSLRSIDLSPLSSCTQLRRLAVDDSARIVATGS
ncbi:MAG: leucine-rich repeat domain-containing protein [Candidatus Thorarchaeota archaeon]|nr:leucine-rich repeat domain-containing protein [Candidatus Thorarchaeota archaeon]